MNSKAKRLIFIKVLSWLVVPVPFSIGCIGASISYMISEANGLPISLIFSGIAFSFAMAFGLMWVWHEHEDDLEEWAAKGDNEGTTQI